MLAPMEKIFFQGWTGFWGGMAGGTSEGTSAPDELCRSGTGSAGVSDFWISSGGEINSFEAIGTVSPSVHEGVSLGFFLRNWSDIDPQSENRLLFR